MKPSAFEYKRPGSVIEAVHYLHQFGEDARVLAGGQSLVPLMNFRLVYPEVLVDINDVDELSGICPSSDGSLSIGALTRQATLLSPCLPSAWRIVREATSHIGHYPIRRRGTVGGSMVHADPAAELPLLALTLEAEFKLRSQTGERSVHADSFFQSHFTTDKHEDELLIEVCFPALPHGTTTAFAEFARRSGDFALVAVAAALTRDTAGVIRRARIGLAGVAATPLRARGAEEELLGTTETASARIAAARAAEDIDPTSDGHASARLRRDLARTLVERVLAQCSGNEQ